MSKIMSEINAEAIIEQLTQYGNRPRQALIALLVDEGMNPDDAARAVDDVALAFCRAAYRFQPLADSAPQQSQRLQQPGQLQPSQPQQPLSVLYHRAYAFASDCGRCEAMDPAVFNALVKLSPEFSRRRQFS